MWRIHASVKVQILARVLSSSKVSTQPILAWLHCGKFSTYTSLRTVVKSVKSNSLCNMSPTKRSLEAVCSPPAKYRLIHSSTEPVRLKIADDCSASDQLLGGPEVRSGDAVLEKNSYSSVALVNNELCQESNQDTELSKDNSEDSQLSPSKQNVPHHRLRRWQEQEKLTSQIKESHINFKKLIAEDSDGSTLEALNNSETQAPTSVVITHQEVEPLKIDFQPADSRDEDDDLFPRRKKRMFAVLLSYSGKGYLGLQNNPGFATIEGELLQAFRTANLLTAAESERLQSVHFQRAARTDKGVSAARQVISVKLPIAEGEEEQQAAVLNAMLPAQIRVMAILRATRSFNSKNWCDYRTYSYLTPSFAFTPMEQVTNEEYRISPEELSSLRKLLSAYSGTRNFHNFTIRKKPTEANAKRYIHSVEVGDPFVRENIEWVLIKIKGQSFMMHQIRKMIGLAMSITRGLAPSSLLLEALSHSKVCTPKAPGLGLVLEQPHYDNYNKKFGQDGQRPSIEWSQLEDKVESFRRDHIERDIIDTELAEKSMLGFIKVLHTYGITPDDDDGSISSGVGRAYRLYERYLEGSEDSSSMPPAESGKPSDGADQPQTKDVTGTVVEETVDLTKTSSSEVLVSSVSSDVATIKTV